MWITQNINLRIFQGTPHKKALKEDGVSVYIHKNVEFKIRNDLSINSKDTESVGVEILYEKGGTLY